MSDFADCPIAFSQITIEYHAKYETTLNTVSPVVRDDGFGNPVSYLDPLLPEVFPKQSILSEIKISAEYQRVYLRDLDFGQPACWMGFRYTDSGGSHQGLLFGFANATGDVTFLPFEIVEFIQTYLEPGQFVAISSCCEPGIIYVLGYQLEDAGTTDGTVVGWEADGGIDAFGYPTYRLVTADYTAVMSAVAYPISGSIGKNWPGGQFNAEADFYIQSSEGTFPIGRDMYGLIAFATLPSPPVSPWNCIPGTYQSDANDSEPASTWEESNVLTHGPTGNTVEDGVISANTTLVISFGSGGGGGEDSSGLSNRGGLSTSGLESSGLTTGQLETGNLQAGSLATSGLESGSLTSAGLSLGSL